QEQSAPKGIASVEQQNVGVALQSQVLEAIVQDEPFRAMSLESQPRLVPIFSDSQLSFSAKPFAEQRHLICRYAALFISAIAARQNCRPLALCTQPFGQPKHHGRLTRAPHGEISNANYRCIQSLRLAHAQPVEKNTCTRANFIQYAEGPKQQP